VPAPANDNFASAEVISGASGSTTGTTFDATDQGTPEGSNDQSVWYKFTAPSTGWFRFYIEDAEIAFNGTGPGDSTLAYMQLYPDGALAAMTDANAIAYAHISGADQDINVVALLTSGQVYYLRLKSIEQFAIVNWSSYAFTLRWGTISTPANDDLASASSLGSIPIAATISTKNATFEAGEVDTPTVGTKHQSVWYKFTPSTTGRYRISVADASIVHDGLNGPDVGTFPSYFRVIIGTVSGSVFTPLTTWEGLDFINATDQEGSAERFAFYPDLTASTEYHLHVFSGFDQKYLGGGYQFNGTTVSFDLEIDLQDVPANDLFANAEVLSTTLPGSTAGTTRDAEMESGEAVINTGGDIQSVWYKFTPTVTGLYRFRSLFANNVYNGDSFPDQGSIAIGISPTTTMAGFTSASLLPAAGQYGQIFSNPNAFNYGQHLVSVADLTSATPYYIRVWSYQTSNIINKNTMSFLLQWEMITPAANDDFADRIVITGASGTQGFDLTGASTETDEPFSFYWNEDFTTGDQFADMASVWYEWVAPSSGWFEFKVETDSTVAPDIAIYTGSALNALTPIARNAGGTYSDDNPNNGGTTIRINATASTNYKIQIAVTKTQANSFDSAGALEWVTASAPTGDITTTAVTPSAGFFRPNNFGNTDNELPPDWLARLTPHGEFWYTEGRVGRSKWFKYDAPADVEVEIRAELYDLAGRFTYSEFALLAYKGANFASLTAATTTDAEDAVMLGAEGPATTIASDEVMFIDATLGETVWVCLVGLFDLDLNANASGLAIPEIDCPQVELDLMIDTGAPANDTRSAVLGLPNDHNYWLALSHYQNWNTFREAGQGVGSTLGATADVGEPAHAGFTATRSVWYMMYIPKPGDYKLWVESAVDCVMAIYNYDGTVSLGSLVVSDDDSGPGNQPEVTHTFGEADDNKWYWVAIDSRTAGEFTFNYQRQSTGTPPANDNFASAVVISSLPFSQAGSTIGAIAEPAEHDAEMLGSGPKDTVWYKYVAPANGRLKVKATLPSNVNEDAYVYIDVWKGTTLANLVRITPPDDLRGFFSFFDTAAELEAQAVTPELDSGETYYIRVQSESGGSEDFTIYVDEAAVYLNLQASGLDEMHGVLIDDAEVYLNLQHSGVEVFDAALSLDAAEVYLNLTASGIEFKAFEYTDSATVPLNLEASEPHECFFPLEPSWTVNGIRKWQYGGKRKFSADGTRRWTWLEGEGLPQEC